MERPPSTESEDGTRPKADLRRGGSLGGRAPFRPRRFPERQKRGEEAKHRAGEQRNRIITLGRFLADIAEWEWPDAPARRLVFTRDIPKLPRPLPRYLPPDQARALLAALETSPNRLRADALLLLPATGMRIGELLNTRMSEVNLREKRITIIEAQKTRVGRVVYLGEDACKALKVWLKRREPEKEYLFYGQGRQRLSYTAVRVRFAKYLEAAGLLHKGYSLHCLRHTCATELLNAGMRLECLQQLLGHSSIEMTRRYARLTDNTRREEYFRAMARIERGESHGHYRRDLELPPVLEAQELLRPHH